MQDGRFDPHDIGNPMLGKPIPDFSLAGVSPALGFSSNDVRAAAGKQPVLLNFFLSSCIPCAEEGATLDALAKQGVAVWGIAWKDKPSSITSFLERFGDPFARVASDSSGSTAIDFGLYGVPESFLVDRQGRIVWHHAGAISQSEIDREILPLIGAGKS